MPVRYTIQHFVLKLILNLDMVHLSNVIKKSACTVIFLDLCELGFILNNTPKNIYATMLI